MRQRIDERLHQPGPVTIAGVKVSTKPAKRLPEGPRRQILTAHPRANQKAIQSNNVREVRAALFVTPADPAIPGRQLQGRRAKTHGTQP